MVFAYEALTANGDLVRERVEAANREEVIETLRTRSLVVLRVDESVVPKGALSHLGGATGRRKVTRRDVLLFARQMKMMLEAGAAIVPALETIERQIRKPAFRSMIHDVRTAVENGGGFADALREHPQVFTPVFCTMVGVGEVTGKLPEVFDRLSILAQRRYNFRKTLVSALVYPAIVGALSFTVVSVLLGFVVPRFRELFLGLNAELPTSTRILLACSDGFVTYWPVLLAITAGLGVAGFVMIRNEPCRRRAGTAMLNMPFVGVLLARLIFATILQVWAAMLQSRVPLLDALEKSKDAVRNAAFLELIDNVQAAVSSGGRVGETLAGSPFVDPMLAAAITTGEDNGHLAEAVEFSSVCADDDNTQLITTLTRIAEPVFIALLGLMVGTVAMSLFLPMFDIAGAARH